MKKNISTLLSCVIIAGIGQTVRSEEMTLRQPTPIAAPMPESATEPLKLNDTVQPAMPAPEPITAKTTMQTPLSMPMTEPMTEPAIEAQAIEKAQEEPMPPVVQPGIEQTPSTMMVVEPPTATTTEKMERQPEMLKVDEKAMQTPETISAKQDTSATEQVDMPVITEAAATQQEPVAPTTEQPAGQFTTEAVVPEQQKSEIAATAEVPMPAAAAPTVIEEQKTLPTATAEPKTTTPVVQEKPFAQEKIDTPAQNVDSILQPGIQMPVQTESYPSEMMDIEGMK